MERSRPPRELRYPSKKNSVGHTPLAVASEKSLSAEILEAEGLPTPQDTGPVEPDHSSLTFRRPGGQNRSKKSRKSF